MKTSKIKYSFFVGVVIFLFLLSGCGHYDASEDNVKDNSTKSSSRLYEYHPENNAKKEAEMYFEYLKEKNIQSLIDLFSSKVQKSHNLRKEWNEFFETIDGNIASYEKITYLGEEVRVDNFRVSYSDIVIRFENVKTDRGELYKRIDYRQLRVDVNHPEAEGISVFSISIPDRDGKDFREVNIGEIIDK